MNAVVAGGVPGRIAKLLAVLCVACFWLLPLSPLVAIGAVSMTRGCSHWARRFALTGAVLCMAYTVVMTLLFVRACLQIRL